MSSTVGNLLTRSVRARPLCLVEFTRPTKTSASAAASRRSISSHIGFICLQWLQPVTANMIIQVRSASLGCSVAGLSDSTSASAGAAQSAKVSKATRFIGIANMTSALTQELNHPKAATKGIRAVSRVSSQGEVCMAPGVRSEERGPAIIQYEYFRICRTRPGTNMLVSRC